MKQILVFTIALFTTVSSWAFDSSYLINAEKDKVMVIDLKQSFGQEVKVSIINLEGDVIFDEQFKSKASLRKYNLSKLGIGTFTVVVEESDKISFQKVYISKNSLLIDNSIEEINKPQLDINANIWHLKNINTTNPGDVEFYDANGLRIFTNKTEGKSEKVYNVAKLQSGEYTLMYTVKGKTFSFTSEKK